MELTQKDILTVLKNALEGNIEQRNEMVDTFVDPTAWALVMKSGEGHLPSKYTDENGNIIPISKCAIQKSVDNAKTGLDAFRRVPQTYSEQEAIKVYNDIFDSSELLASFSRILGSSLTVPIDIWQNDEHRIIDTVRSGTAYTGNASGENEHGVSKLGKELYLFDLERPFVITYREIFDNLYNPNFTNIIKERVAVGWRNDLLDLFTNGVSDTCTDNTKANFYKRMVGFIKQYQDTSSAWSNSNGLEAYNGLHGQKVTPVKINATSYISGGSITTSKLLSLMEKMHKSIPERYAHKANEMVYMLSWKDYLTYQEARRSQFQLIDSTKLSNTLESKESLLSFGGVVPFLGHRVVYNPFMASVGESTKTFSGTTLAGSILLVNLKDIIVGGNRFGVRKHEEYKDSLPSGGSGFQYNMHLCTDVQTVNSGSAVIAFAGASVEDTVLTSDANGTTVVNKNAAAAGDVEAETTYYVWNNTPNCRIFYSDAAADLDDLADAIANADGEIGNGGTITTDAEDGDSVFIGVYADGEMATKRVVEIAAPTS